MDNSERFWNASVEQLKRGYVQEGEYYICLLCGQSFEKGIIYPDGESGILYEAEKFARVHIERVHGSVFDHLIGLDKKMTGLTEHQNRLLQLFYQGKNDAEIQRELGIGSASTIRNHRFALKEKERQAKVLLTVMELLKEKDSHAPSFVNVHVTAKWVDDRYNLTRAENEKILNQYFPDGKDGPLKKFPLKEKQRLAVVRHIAARFPGGRIYTEKEVNGILQEIYDDYAILRRYLIEYGFMDRKPDGSEYWLKAESAR